MENLEEKRFANNYEITQSFRIGEVEIVFGEDKTCDMPYFCAVYIDREIIGEYTDALVSNGYVELAQVFAQRIAQRAEQLQKETEALGELAEPFPVENCYPHSYSENLEGKIVCMKSSALRPEFRNQTNQLYLVRSGSGASPNSRGRAMFCSNLYNGKKGRWNREDVQGVVREEAVPKWAIENKAIFEKIEKDKQKKEAR